MLALNYLGIVTASLGMLIFLPQIVKQLGLTNMQVGWVTMIPYICGAISMVVWGMLFDRTGERRWNLTLACVVATAGLIVAGLSVGTVWALAGMSIAAIGFYGSKGPFWSMPPMFLTARRLPRASRGSTHSAISAASLDPPSWAGSETRPAVCRRALCARRIRAHVGRGLGSLAAHPSPDRGTARRCCDVSGRNRAGSSTGSAEAQA